MNTNTEPRLVTHTIRYHCYTIWLFTYSELKSIIIPSTVFAIIHKAGSSAFEVSQQNDGLVRNILQIFLVVTWVWLNLLPWNIDNQRQRDGIEEDRHNKPWRPIPSGRITSQQAAIMMLLIYPAAIVFSGYLGCLTQSLALVTLGIWYNDLGGADASWIIRNFINACGFVCFTSGALQVLLRRPVFMNTTLDAWFVIIGGVVCSTVHAQDMHDQVGDSQRGRKTAPLVLGDGIARWTIALPMLLWSWFCPHFWSIPAAGFLAPVALGSTVAYRTLSKREVRQDKITWRIWNLWLVVLYTLPLVRSWTL